MKRLCEPLLSCLAGWLPRQPDFPPSSTAACCRAERSRLEREQAPLLAREAALNKRGEQEILEAEQRAAAAEQRAAEAEHRLDVVRAAWAWLWKGHANLHASRMLRLSAPLLRCLSLQERAKPNGWMREVDESLKQLK